MSFEGTHAIAPHVCQCGYKPTRTITSDGSAPGEGDVSVCFKCGKITIFSSDGTQREMTQEDEKSIRESGQWNDVIRARDLVLSKNMM